MEILKLIARIIPTIYEPAIKANPPQECQVDRVELNVKQVSVIWAEKIVV